MRELILKMSISIDGFVGDADGHNTWMFGSDQEAKNWSVETIWSAGLHIMGSRTFLGMAGFWPTAPGPFAPPMNQIPKAVFSRSEPSLLKRDIVDTADDAAKSWSEAEIIGGDLSEEIARLKAQPGKPIMAHGGAGFARALIARRLIDRYVLLVHPIALGAGLPLFSDLAEPMPLTLVSSNAFPGGAVAQVYRPA